MNEQQLADLFSNQLDQLLQGQTPALPPEASDLQGLLDFGQQFSQITFQPSTAAQTAFQGQIASWFGTTPGGIATILGVPKTLLFTLIGAAILVGIGAGLTVLDIPSADDSNGLSAPEAPAVPIQDTPDSPAVDSGSEVTPKTPQSSLEETIPGGGNSSLGDTVPSSSPSLGDTLPLSTPSPTATVEDDVDADVGSGDGVTDSTDDASDDSTGGEDTQAGDHDRGHGNDADGTDEDNPGNSGGSNNQGQDNGVDGLGRNNNNGNGQDGGSGQGGGKGNGQGGGKGKGSGSKK